jgi:uncharacterized protein YecE (DUF72 family)
MMSKFDWFLGTMGFGYKEWEGEFYPIGMPTHKYLRHYSRVFNAVELDTTFYGPPPKETVIRWHQESPEYFIFCVKTPRSITHDSKLKGVDGLMSEFIDVIRCLDQKLGLVLIQLPPSYSIDYLDSFISFIETLPGDIKFAVEFRNISWYTHKTADLLKSYSIGWTAIDFPNLPIRIYPSTDYLYVRWVGRHGEFPMHNYERVEKSGQLEIWYKELQKYEGKFKSVYGFFNNDYTGFAVGTCNRFKKMIGLPVQSVDVPKQSRFL